MKKFRIFLAVGISLIVCFCLLNLTLPFTDHGSSTLYSEKEIEEAMQIVRNEFVDNECKLYSISYTSDEKSRRELEHCNELNHGDRPYTECLVFETKFRSPMFGGGAWSANRVYDWTWFIARTRNGDWEIVDRGVC